ncbi:MAG: SsrA-binding protein [Bacteroidales bacterium]|nr:SsrA-binding protein [Bacteroidales bacterium]
MQNLLIKNKKAFFNYEIVDTYTAGIQLYGTEVKSVRDSKVSFTDAYCLFINQELWLRGIHISEYAFGSYNNHVPKRDRKLLLNKKEIQKIQKQVSEKSLTIVPLKIFFNENGFVKVEIGIARGKKKFDKRETLKEKDTKRDLDRVMKH